MSVIIAFSKDDEPSKVHPSEYIRTENKPDDVVSKPAEPAAPAQPEAK